MLFYCICLLLSLLHGIRCSSLNGKGLNSFGSLVRGGASDDNMLAEEIDGRSVFGSKRRNKEREQLYEAYNLLHTLAQDFHKPFDSPAVIVVGHQTSGKSALIEALMGFQFNQVGGGTKTRRPVALRMQYNPSCTQPLCFLTLENGREEQRSLADIQAYIESENKRLERDPSRCFDPREINIRMEYKYCPNMIVIDTPGMLHPPKGKQLTPQQRAFAQAAKEAESLVLNKIRCQDYIILCVEDTTDWKHATTRNVVMQADPELARTVLVTTKLDTKLPQFSEAEDLEDFLQAPLITRIFPHMLGGPFFTSVPSGRVGQGKEFSNNEDFVKALRIAEKTDQTTISSKLSTVVAGNSLSKVGVKRLRTFLEARVEDCYKRNVAKIVPLLQTELRLAESKLIKTDAEIAALSIDRLKQSANVYRELFAKELANAIHGTVKASPEEWGESLETEQLRGGSFLDQEQVNSEAWQHLLELEVGNGKHKLFGGAQYHRALREFTVAVRHMGTPIVTEDEIANAAGIGDVHDGVNFMRAACVIAVEKAQQSFEPMLEALRHRAVHIMRRLYPVVEHIIRKSGAGLPMDNYNRPFADMIRRSYDKFVEQQINICLEKCRDDLKGMTRFVTWDVDGKGGSSALYKSLPTPKKMVEIYSVAVDHNSSGSAKKDEELANAQQSRNNNRRAKNRNKRDDDKSTADRVLDEWANAQDRESNTNGNDNNQGLGLVPSQMAEGEEAQLSDYYDLLQLTEEMVAGRNVGRTNTVVTALVQYIIRSWRDHYARTVAMKFNCFFLMPFLDEFPAFLRHELDTMYESNVNEMFDIQEARAALQNRRTDLEAECVANSKLQRRFDLINAQLSKGPSVDELSASMSDKEQESVNINLVSGMSNGSDMRTPHFGKWNRQGQTMEDI
jgi:GTPase SAR1 family protein